MKRPRCFLGLAASLVVALAAQAQPAQSEYSPEAQLEFARTLRDRKGYVDLALQYLEGIANPPEELRPIVQFEVARTRLMLARGLDPEERLEAIGLARKELEEFVKKFAAAKEAQSVRLELRRLPGEQAQATLSLALRSRGIDEKQKMADEAKKFFVQAAVEIEASLKDLETDDQRNQARYELAVNKMDQARCHVNLDNEDIRNKRAELIGEARKMFEDLTKKSNRVGFSSRAWLIKCCSEDEGSDPLKADEYYDQLKNLGLKDAEEARRLARYFEMVRIPLIMTPKNPVSKLNKFERYQKVQADAEAWLKAYPSFYKNPLGYGVRYELANALYNQALLTKDAAKKGELFSRAQELLYALNESDNDLIGKVGSLRSRIARVHVSGKAESNINELATFDECNIRGLLEYDRVQHLVKQLEEARDPEAKSKIEKELRDSLRNVTDALSRALLVADRRTPRYALENARSDLLDAYAMRESPVLTRAPYRTVVYGEAIAKADPPSKNGPRALELAIDACVRLINIDPSAGNREKLRSLAEYAVSPERNKLWEKHNVIGVAQYHLAMLDQAEATLYFAEAEKVKDNPEAVKAALKAGRDKLQQAVEHFRKIPASDVSRHYYAQSKAVFLAIEARDKVAFPEEKKFYREEARKLIAALPKQLVDGLGPSTIDLYLRARMEEAKLLYEEAVQFAVKKDADRALAKYKEMADLLDRIAGELDGPAVKKSKFDEDSVRFFAYYIGAMQKYAAFGQADFEYRAGNYDKVLEPGMTGKVVEFVARLAEKNPLVRLKDFQLTGQIISLALRASVQTGKFDEARKLLKLLENLKDEKDNALAEASSALRNLANDLDAQVRDLQRNGDAVQLKRTQDRFSEFLDGVLTEPDRKVEKKDLFSLARCCDTLDQHDKAAALYRQFLSTPEPGRKDAVPEYLNAAKKDNQKLSDEEERELQTYCYAQVMLARQLRLAKQPAEAKKILDHLAAQSNARQLLHVEKEQIYLLQDKELYGTATTRWENFMKSPAFKTIGGDEERKKLYFDAYFNRAYCLYKYSQSDKVKGAGKDGPYLSRAVDYIVRLEMSPVQDGWQLVGHRFRELMQQEKVLKEAYDKQKAGG